MSKLFYSLALLVLFSTQVLGSVNEREVLVADLSFAAFGLKLWGSFSSKMKLESVNLKSKSKVIASSSDKNEFLLKAKGIQALVNQVEKRKIRLLVKGKNIFSLAQEYMINLEEDEQKKSLVANSSWINRDVPIIEKKSVSLKTKKLAHRSVITVPGSSSYIAPLSARSYEKLLRVNYQEKGLLHYSDFSGHYYGCLLRKTQGLQFSPKEKEKLLCLKQSTIMISPHFLSGYNQMVSFKSCLVEESLLIDHEYYTEVGLRSLDMKRWGRRFYSCYEKEKREEKKAIFKGTRFRRINITNLTWPEREKLNSCQGELFCLKDLFIEIGYQRFVKVASRDTFYKGKLNNLKNQKAVKLCLNQGVGPVSSLSVLEKRFELISEQCFFKTLRASLVDLRKKEFLSIYKKFSIENGDSVFLSRFEREVEEKSRDAYSLSLFFNNIWADFYTTSIISLLSRINMTKSLERKIFWMVSGSSELSMEENIKRYLKRSFLEDGKRGLYVRSRDLAIFALRHNERPDVQGRSLANVRSSCYSDFTANSSIPISDIIFFCNETI